MTSEWQMAGLMVLGFLSGFATGGFVFYVIGWSRGADEVWRAYFKEMPDPNDASTWGEP
jgi:hypothetical protein